MFLDKINQFYLTSSTSSPRAHRPAPASTVRGHKSACARSTRFHSSLYMPPTHPSLPTTTSDPVLLGGLFYLFGHFGKFCHFAYLSPFCPLKLVKNGNSCRGPCCREKSRLWLHCNRLQLDKSGFVEPPTGHMSPGRRTRETTSPIHHHHREIASSLAREHMLVLD